MRRTLLTLAVASGLVPIVSQAWGQYERFVITNIGTGYGLSSTNGSWCYYTLNVSTSANGKAWGAGMRHDIGQGFANVAPSNSVVVTIDTNTSGYYGPIATNTTPLSTFIKRVVVGGLRTNIALTNEQVSEAAFFVLRLVDTNGADAGLLKGAHVYNYYRTQTVASASNGLVYGWTNNYRNADYSGQAFGSFQDMTGALFLGD